MNQLKSIKPEVENCSSCVPFKLDHQLILEMSKLGQPIPLLTLEQAELLLHSMKPLVCDHFNISALHYINGALPEDDELYNRSY